MSNPNTQKLGKRKMAPGSKAQADWLFPQPGNPIQRPSLPQSKKAKNNEKKLAEDLLKRKAAGESPKSTAPTQLIQLVGAFLSENEYTHTSRSFLSERGSATVGTIAGLPSLTTIYNEWSQFKEEKNKPVVQNGVKEEVKEEVKPKSKGKSKAKGIKEASSSSDSSSASSSEDSDTEMVDAPAVKVSRKSPSTSSSSSSDSDADDEKEAPATKAASPKPKAKSLKRKASVSSSSSSSSGSSSSSSEDEAPKAKKVKTKSASSTSGSSSSSSDSDTSSRSSSSSSSASEKVKKSQKSKKSKKKGSDSSSSDSTSSSSSSGSGSESESSTNSIAQKVPLPDSDSDSTTSSSEDDSPPKKNLLKKQGSDTSATLSDGPKKSVAEYSSTDSSSVASYDEPAPILPNSAQKAARALSPPLPPNPAVKQKKVNEPFSRIPKDIKVDERLASNKFVPYDYAQKAHQDLIVTKGKGFTKEKNKKKRGSYKGGYIDVEGKKGIKFDD